MKLMVQSYNSGGSVWNAEAEETAFLYYAPTHGFDSPAEVTITLADSTGLIAQKYIVDTDKALAGGVADDGGVETDETTATNNATANDMTLLPAAPVVNDAYYFAFNAATVAGFALNIGTAGVEGALGGWTITWEYSQGADAWAALAGVTDDTTGFTVAGENSVSWTIPGDWATDEVGAIAGKYWVRGRVSAFLSINVQPLGTQAWYDEIWLGAGKITIEDPTATDIFYGRIMKAMSNTDSRTVTLYCQDWLSQLDEEQITYDMREDLDGSGLRQSELKSDPDNGTYVGPAYTSGATYWVFDDDMAWSTTPAAAQNFDGMKLVLSNAMAGKVTCTTGPYADDVTWHSAEYNEAGSFADLWVDDANSHDTDDADAAWEVVYSFRVYLGHNTPSDFYVHDSISAARVRVGVYNYGAVGATCTVGVWTGAAYVDIGVVPRNVARQIVEFNIPAQHLSSVVDANGIAKVQFKLTANGDFDCHMVQFEVEVDTTGYSSNIAITTSEPNYLVIGTDMTAAATRVWETLPYAICRPIYKHIASDETPGNLITDGDTMVTLTCAGTIEHTSGISTRQYVGKTRLEALKDLAVQDKAHFWITLGGVVVTYKSTFTDAAPETLTDTDLNSIRSTYDYSTLTNETTVYGMRIGDSRLSSTYTDATSEAKYKQTRTKVTSDTGLVSEYDTLARATALVNQYKDVQQILTATIRGNTAKAAHDKTLVLGDEVSITSTYLGLSAAVYIVQRWSYDSNNNLTTLLLHPRVSAIGLQKDERPSFEQVMQAGRRGTADTYIASPETNEVA